MYRANSTIKLADDTAMVGLVTDSDDTDYTAEVEQ